MAQRIALDKHQASSAGVCRAVKIKLTLRCDGKKALRMLWFRRAVKIEITHKLRQTGLKRGWIVICPGYSRRIQIRRTLLLVGPLQDVFGENQLLRPNQRAMATDLLIRQANESRAVIVIQRLTDNCPGVIECF